MTELIVDGIEGTHYIIEVNGEKKTVQKGDSVLFNEKEDAQYALENVTIIGGGFLFHEKIKKDNKVPEIKSPSITLESPREEGDKGILETGNKVDPNKFEKRELKKDGKNNENS